MERNTEPRKIEMPENLAGILDQNSKVKEVFETLPYSHKKEYIDWISSAKKPETRKRRILKMIEMLQKKQKLS